MKPIRIIPRLDVKGQNLVKGIHLEGLRVLGLPERFSRYYFNEGADELIYIDMVASLYGRNNLEKVVTRTAENVFIPIVVGGGLRSIDDIRRLLRAGADKVAINTAAIRNPRLIEEAAKTFGSQCIVISVQAMRVGSGKYEAYTDAGREPTGRDVIEWIKEAEDRGAGEILITSIEQEGTGAGYDIELITKVVQTVSIPVIACGGAGRIEDIEKLIRHCNVDGVSAASIFHYHILKEFGIENREGGNVEYLRDFIASGGGILKKITPVSITGVKKYLSNAGISCINITKSVDDVKLEEKKDKRFLIKNNCKTPVVVIMDYGLGNLFSVAHAFENEGIKVEITNEPSKIWDADRLVIAGVGAFGDGLRRMQEMGLIPALQEYIARAKPLLGICLGMQLLMDEGEEFGHYPGLGFIPGKVVRLTEMDENYEKVKIPHIGWNQINYPRTNKSDTLSLLNGENWDEVPIMRDVSVGSFVYFAHSYIVIPEDPNTIIAETRYGPNRFCSIIRKGNIWGCQFHPEKSGLIGLKILRNFVYSL